MDKAGIQSSLCDKSYSSYPDKNEVMTAQVDNVGYELSPDKVIFFDKPPLM